MFKNNYYYIVSGLPDIIPEQSKIPHGVIEFKQEISNNLSVSDYRLLEKIFLNIDNINILNILEKNKKDFIDGGKYNQSELEAAAKEPELKESYINTFIKAYKAEVPVFEGYKWEDQLTWLYYDHLINHTTNDFIKKYFEFNQNINNIIVALNSRKFELKNKKAIIGNNEVAQAVRNSTLKDFGLSADFPIIDKLLSIYDNDNLVSRERAIDKIKWDFMDDLNTFNYFTIEVIFAYVIKIRMIERWIKLDEETGRKMFKKLLSDLNNSFEFAKEFDVGRR